MKHKKLIGNGLLLFTAMIWGTAFAAQRIGTESLEPATFTAARMLLSAVMVGLLSALPGFRSANSPASKGDTELKQYRKSTVTGGVLCGLFLCIATLLQQAGLTYTTSGKAGFITAMYMLIVPIISLLIFRRKYSWLVWLSVLLGVIGMYFLCITESFSLSNGDGLVFLCAVVFSCHILCCDHFVKTGNPIRMSAIQFVTATLVSAVVAAFTETPTPEKLLSALIPIAYCGIVSGGIGYTLQMVAQKLSEPTTASLLMSMESVFSVIAGVILLNEHMSIREAAGCLIMLAAIILVQIPLPSGKDNREVIQ